GAVDAYAFGRAGRQTGASLGLALAWVASDDTELHASARWLQRHEGWQLGGSAWGADGRPTAISAENPWSRERQAGGQQWLLGGTWTGQQQQSLLFEAWHDGTAPLDAQWRTWQDRNAGLAQKSLKPALPPAAQAGLAGNLAWQTSPLAAASLRRDNLFLRLAWQPEPWQLSLDALFQPADRGHSLTAALQWQGDLWRMNLSLRQNGGPGRAVLAQVPTGQTALLSATRAF
ncbi:hypothetical protein, partial [Ideonella sp.]|uniref:hypothetical protein n=1 Tax=Ideonella sp. TaxID=1929293 RepID=UPI003BB66C45